MNWILWLALFAFLNIVLIPVIYLTERKDKELKRLTGANNENA